MIVSDRSLRWVACISFNLLFGWWIIFTLMALLAAAWIIVGSFIASPFILALSVLDWREPIFSMNQTVGSIVLAVIGLVGLPVTMKITLWMKDRLRAYWNWNRHFVLPDRSDEVFDEGEEDADSIGSNEEDFFDDF